MDQDNKLHVAIISSPGMGHLLPVLLLGNRLTTHHHLHVTILAVTTQTSPVESQLFNSHTDSARINLIKIPSPDISNLLHPDDTVVTQLTIIMREAIASIRAAISGMTPRPHVLVADLFSSESLPIANEFHMQKYAYIPCHARFVALTMYLPVLDKEVKGQYVDQVEPLRVPGCVPVQVKDVPDPMLDRNNRQYNEYVRMGVDFATLSDGVLINTWRDLDRTTIDALKYDEILRSVVKVPVYDIGPLTREADPPGLEGNKVIELWLDMQPLESVLFVSFGSGGTPSAKQITELAWGLELSRQRFVWVVRPPAGRVKDGRFFTAGSGPDGPPDFLPEGFLDRTRELGLIVPLWAPQVRILNHEAVGGFLTHCGLNSVYESVRGGVPMIAWPLYSEQRLNASLLTGELQVAIRPAVWPAERDVEREEIEKMVRCLMEGEEGKTMRKNVKLLRESGNQALMINGSSYESMCEFITRCQLKI